MVAKEFTVPCICIVGPSNSGKTTLVSKLIGDLTKKGFRVGTIKHAAHGFELPKEGKDSFVHKSSGAKISVVASPSQVAVVRDTEEEWGPLKLLSLMDGVDLVILEGFKGSNLPKIEIFKKEEGRELPLCLGQKELVAIVSEEESNRQWGIPVFAPDDIDGISRFILRYLDLEA